MMHITPLYSIHFLIKMSDDINEESAEKSEIRNASEWIPIPVIVFLLIIALCVLEKINHKVDLSSNAKRTKWLMNAVIISNLIGAISSFIWNTMCFNCPIQAVELGDTRLIMKWVNYLFLIHRAKLAQGMTPLLSKKWFNKIIPGIITFVFVISLVFSTLGLLKVYKEYGVCGMYHRVDGMQFCFLAGGYDNKMDDENLMALLLFLGIDLVFASVLLTLFVVPLYRVSTTDLGALNDNQRRQRRKLKTLLIWSMAMCFVNQVTAIFWILPMFGDSQVIWVLTGIAKFDPAINVWSSWLMITRNRQYLRQLMHVSCCQAQQSDRSSDYPIFTDVSDMQSLSRMDSRNRGFLRMFTGSQTSLRVRSATDLQLTIEEDPDRQNVQA